METITIEIVKKHKIFSWVMVILALLIIGVLLLLIKFSFTNNKVKNFAECASAGHTTTKTEPRQCSTDTGLRFIEQVKKEEVQF